MIPKEYAFTLLMSRFKLDDIQIHLAIKWCQTEYAGNAHSPNDLRTMFKEYEDEYWDNLAMEGRYREQGS